MNYMITKCEKEAVLTLLEYESVKIAADKRIVSFDTEKNQIRSVMEKLGVNTQIGLAKKMFSLLYGVKFDMEEAKKIAISVVLLLLVSFDIATSNNHDMIRPARQTIRVKRD